MANDPAPLFSIDFTDSIAMTNLCTVAVRRNSVSTRRDLVRDLSGENIPDRPVLVYNAKGLTIDLDNAGDSGGTVITLEHCSIP